MTLKQVRSAFAAPWIALVFGAIYLLGQLALAGLDRYATASGWE